MSDILDTAKQLTGYDSVRDFLYGLRYHGAKYGLDRVERFAGIMGHPERGLPCIHVAGTNGKGSTCAMLEQVFRDQGYRTGLYSSPHLIRQGERIQVNRKILEESEIVRLTKLMVARLLESDSNSSDDWPSFFEFMTVMAWVYFQECGVDIALIETGLGGRLDATNILKPEISVITSISLDHTNILGDTIEEIAGEKAGIIKPNTPVVLGRLSAEAEAVIRAKALEKDAEVFTVFERWGDSIDGFPHSNLSGEYQRINAATALLVCEVINNRQGNVKSHLSLSEAEESLQRVEWPGRWEKLFLVEPEGQEVILDASHNEEGARMLEKNLQQLIASSGEKPVVAVGSLGEDRAVSLLAVVCKYAERIYLLHPNQPRALTHGQLRKCIPVWYKGKLVDARVDDLFSYQKTSIGLNRGQVLLVTGSIYLIGEVSDRLKSHPVVDQQSLQDVI